MGEFERARWAVSHDPCRAGDRSPSGAVPAGSVVHVALRIDDTARSAVASADVLVSGRSQDCEGLIWSESALFPSAEGFCGDISTGMTPHVFFYVFKLALSDGTVAYLVPHADGKSTAGELVAEGADGTWSPGGWLPSEERTACRKADDFGIAASTPGFQVTVYHPSFSTPSWSPGAIMYQIFPDRFARGPQGVRKSGLEYHARMNRTVRLHESWNEPVAWEPIDETSDDPRLAYFDPVDFFGGTLEGIRQKLPYLASLGVEVIYLNPVFEARSNHRYDTADYEHIDPLLGSDQDLTSLTKTASELGISIILDAVLSHTGNDSRYFNALGTYEQAGAAQGFQSEFFRWYDFKCANDDLPYRCWWGDPTLPEVDEHDQTWQNYILGTGGILQRWLAAGARGYRLDVADEIPDDVLEGIRTCVKAAKSDALIIGEVWEDATTKESYGTPRTYALGTALDSVMNYPLRSALLGFALGMIDAFQLVTFFKLQHSSYPAPLYSCLMNLLSSHDVERVRSALVLGKALRHVPRADQVELLESITPDEDARAALMQRMIVAFLYALPGMPCIYYGDERGLQGGGDPFCRATMPWDETKSSGRSDRGEDLTGFYREIGQLRKHSAVLRTGSFACTAPNPEVACLMRVGGEGESVAVAVMSRSNEPLTVAFDAGAAEFGLSEGDSRIARRLTGDVSATFTSMGATSCVLHCEDGVFSTTIPAHTTAVWLIA